MPSQPHTHAPAQLSPSLEDACQRWAERPALTHRGHSLSYGELWERILALAWSYRSLGIRPGDRIVCQLPTSPQHLIALGAAWGCGAIHVGAHPDLTSSELDELVKRTGAAALLTMPSGTEDPLAAVAAVQARHESLIVIVDGWAAPTTGDCHRFDELTARPVHRARPPVPGGPSDAALLVLSSGTTGVPKAVVETLPALWGKLQLFAGAIAPCEDDVHLVCLPICHIFGLKLALMALATGSRLVLVDRFSPKTVLSLAAEERATVLPATPTHLTLLLRQLHHQADALGCVRCVPFAAAPPPPALIEELYARLDAELVHIYGCSEGFVTLTTDPAEIRRGAAGRTVFTGPPGTPPTGALAILDTAGDTRLAANEVGEIAFGVSRPVRYWDAAPAGRDGWYRTGDLGWLDDDGCLTVCGRLKDVVNRGGLKVACAEIEAAVSTHPKVAECAVLASPDPILGEAICACIVPRGPRPPSLAEVRGALSPRLARHKLPDELCLLESLPRARMGKVDRGALRLLVFDECLPRERLRPMPPPSRISQ